MKRSRNVGKSSPWLIKHLREELDVSQARLGELLGVNTNTISRWERGDLTPPKTAELAIRFLIVDKEDK